MIKFKISGTLKTAITLVIISLTYFATRLINLTSLPVFADEAIYIRWSQVMKSVETLRFLPLTDGKQPLFMWLTIPFLKFFPDPLFAGRFLSVLSGFLSVLGVYLLTNLLFNSKITKTNPLNNLYAALSPTTYSVVATSIYIFTTFTFFFDRLATPDSLLSMILIYCSIFFLLQASYLRLDLAFILGGLYGLAWLTKSPAIYHFLLFSGLVFVKAKPKLLNLVLICITGFIMYAIYNILRLGPQFHMIALRNQDYVWSISEVLKHPLDPLKPHFFALLSIYKSYLGMVLLILPLVFIPLKNLKKIIIPTVAWLIPTIAVLATAKIFTSRYILFTIPYLIILLSWCWANYIKKSKLIVLIIYLAFLLPQLKNFNTLIFHPIGFLPPTNDRGYVFDWTSGWGIKTISQYLISEARSGKNVIVATEGNFGTLPDGLQIYTNQEPRLTVVGIGIGQTSIPDGLKKAIAFGDSVYMVVNESRLGIMPHELQNLSPTIIEVKPGNDSLRLYQLR